MQTGHRLEVLLQDADGAVVTKVNVNFDAPDPPPQGYPATRPQSFCRGASRVDPMLPNPGRYSLEILIDGVHQRSIGFTAQRADIGGNDDDAQQ